MRSGERVVVTTYVQLTADLQRWPVVELYMSSVDDDELEEETRLTFR